MDLKHFDMTNPFTFIQKEEDVPTFVSALVKNFKRDTLNSKPERAKCRDALLQSLVFYLYKQCRRCDQNLSNVYKLLAAAEIRVKDPNYKSPLDIIFEDLAEIGPDHVAVKQYSIFKETNPAVAYYVVDEIKAEMIVLGWESKWSFQDAYLRELVEEVLQEKDSKEK